MNKNRKTGIAAALTALVLLIIGIVLVVVLQFLFHFQLWHQQVGVQPDIRYQRKNVWRTGSFPETPRQHPHRHHGKVPGM